MQRTDERQRRLAAGIDAPAIRGILNGTSALVMTAIISTVTGFLLGLAALFAATDPMPLWLLARAGGITAYLLLTIVTAMGILLSHNTRARHRPHPSRIRVHLAMVVFTLVFTVLHIVVLAVDPYAKVGVLGALLPMASTFEPVEVTLGVLALWAGVIAGTSAALAGRGAGRIWLQLHRFAAASWVLAWVHAVLTGVDTADLVGMYVFTGLGVMGLALWRYLSREKVVEQALSGRAPVVVR